MSTRAWVPQWVIEKKRDGRPLSDEEIEWFIGGFTRGEIPDYQMAALAMAICLRGMTTQETVAFTRAMVRSGDVLDLSSVPGPKVDKHSTGGIGDKISLVLAPLLAACDVRVPMVSGRGLGITGGTLDKLEAIPGFRTGWSDAEVIRLLNEVGCVVVAPTERLAPADRKLYALRDVTGTVPSVPLIVSSILSKKVAEGVEHLILDVKCGRGAFMKSEAAARELAEGLLGTATQLGLDVRALITDMNQPLGRAVGNAVEVQEAIETLRGAGPEDVRHLTVELGAELLHMAGRVPTVAAGRERLNEALRSGQGLAKFRAMVEAQGGDGRVVDDPDRLPAAPIRRPWSAPTTGWIAEVDAERIGRAVLVLGGGRQRMEDSVDPAVGLSDLVKVGERVEKGAPLGVVHARDEDRFRAAAAWLTGAFVISETPVEEPHQILARLTSSS
jgi:pyrimidine-nucleoside phosphorylase